MSIVNDAGFVTLMIAHLVRCHDLASRVSLALDPDDFNRAGESGARIVWSVAKEWHGKRTDALPKQYLALAVSDRLMQASGMSLMDGTASEVYSFIDRIYAFDDSELIPSAIQPYIQRFLDERRLKPMALAIERSEPGADLERVLNDLDIARSKSRLTTAEPEDLFSPESAELTRMLRYPTGVPVVDLLLNGGMSPGETYGLAGLTGNGKSTLSAMIGCSIAKSERHVALFSYEVPVRTQLKNLIYANLSDVEIPRSAMSAVVNPSEADRSMAMDERYAKPILEALSKYGKYLSVFDMKKNVADGVGTGGAAEIRTLLRQQIARGKKPSLVIIDQLPSMLESWLVSRGIPLNDAREYWKHMINDLRNLPAGDQLCDNLLIVNQMTAALLDSSPTRIPNAGDVAEDKSFAFNLSFCMLMSKKDSNGCCWITVPKAREGASLKYVVRINPEFPRIDYEPERWRQGDRKFIDQMAAAHDRDIASMAEVDRVPPEGFAFVQY